MRKVNVMMNSSRQAQRYCSRLNGVLIAISATLNDTSRLALLRNRDEYVVASSNCTLLTRSKVAERRIKKQNGSLTLGCTFDPFCVTTIRKLGAGSNADVYAGYAGAKSCKFSIALKIANSASKDVEKFEKERRILETLQVVPDHIVLAFGYSQADEALAMELLRGGDLWEKRDFFPLDGFTARKVIRQVVEAVADCHQQYVAHRDLKESQFVFQKNFDLKGWNTRLKLVDFGEAIQLDFRPVVRPWARSKWVAKVGSYSHLSPEAAWNGIFHGFDGELKTFSAYAPDIWAIGVIAYQVAIGGIFIDDLFVEVERHQPDEKRKTLQETHTFQGEMGVVCDEHGIVQKVIANKPAHTKGIKEGSQIVKIDRMHYSNISLARVVKSGFQYEVTVRSPNIAALSLMSRMVSATKEDIESLLSGKVRTPFVFEGRFVSGSLYDFLAKCLNVDPNKRPSAKKLLQHPWLIESDTSIPTEYVDKWLRVKGMTYEQALDMARKKLLPEEASYYRLA